MKGSLVSPGQGYRCFSDRVWLVQSSYKEGAGIPREGTCGFGVGALN
jgi:hypothetical protein